MDPDFLRDYPPYPELPHLKIPLGYKVIYAKDKRPEEMPVLLQRTKIVLDLG